MKLSILVLAGGKGERMKSSLPKQFMQLGGKTVVEYSIDFFLSLEEVDEVVVVCPEGYRHLLKSKYEHLIFAEPGLRRQDSVFNGLQQLSTGSDFVCVHDAARPCLSVERFRRLLQAGFTYGAATLAVRVKSTIKEGDQDGFVVRTLDRECLWEAQTPQVASLELLNRSFFLVNEEEQTVTDDVSLVELLDEPVKLVEGSACNIKITTPEDFILCERLLAGGNE